MPTENCESVLPAVLGRPPRTKLAAEDDVPNLCRENVNRADCLDEELVWCRIGSADPVVAAPADGGGGGARLSLPVRANASSPPSNGVVSGDL